MKKQNSKPGDAANLRQKAEEELKRKKSQTNRNASEANMLKLIHELEVHQIELELQNEELVAAKEKAEQGEKKYAELYDFAPSGYLTITNTGDISYLNFAAACMLDKERSKLTGIRFGLFISQNTLSDFNLFIQKIFATETKQSCEAIISTRNNAPINATIEGIISKDKEACHLTIIDITQRKQNEQLLKEKNKKIESQNKALLANNKALIEAKEIAEENEEKFKSVFNRVADAIFIYDPETFNIIEANEATSKMYGYDREQLIGMSCLLFSAEVEASKSTAKNVLNKGEYIVNLRHHKKKDGTDLFIQIQGHKIFSRKQPMLFAVSHDITNIIKSEQDLRAAKEKAEESDRLKSAFLANMSHEIRTPMNGILGFAELLKEPDLAGDEQQEYIRIIEKSGKRMLNIINDIVDISKIESSLMELDIKQTNINEQIAYIYTFFKPEAEAQKIAFSFKTPLPNEEMSIKTDSEKVYAIFTNLVKNAMKFTKKGSIEFGYKTLETHKPDFLLFYVKDTGIGIPRNRQKAIFERFIQADISDKMAQQGAGLGLAISKAYVEMLGGEIWTESQEGKGSTFYFTLPYNNTKEETNQQEPEITEEQYIGRPLKTLIVEDDMVSEILIKKRIKPFSKEILNAFTGLEAVNVCRDNPDIDLIIMDIRLPELCGYEATKQIRKFNKDVVIIAQTAYALSGDSEKSIESGCNDYITKPIKKSELIGLIQKYFGE